MGICHHQGGDASVGESEYCRMVYPQPCDECIKIISHIAVVILIDSGALSMPPRIDCIYCEMFLQLLYCLCEYRDILAIAMEHNQRISITVYLIMHRDPSMCEIHANIIHNAAIYYHLNSLGMREIAGKQIIGISVKR